MSKAGKLESKLDEKAIKRRLDFILAEAQSENPIRDMAVTYAMRVVSAYASVGKDFGSRGIKKKSKRISRKALELKQLTTESEWLANVINEHQEPLKRVWQWIKKECNTLTADKILARFKQWPMVTVTKEEDILLRKYPNLDPEARYREAGIEVIVLDNK